MLSSPRLMSSCQQAAKVSKGSTANDRHFHQTIYVDGHQRYIVESHRAIGSPRGVDAKAPRRSHCLVIHSEGGVSSKRSASQSSLSSSSSKTSSPAERAALASSRDMRDMISHELSQAGTIVAGSLTYHPVAVEVDRRVKARPREEPTPPPTPLLRRLPSPELSDLDEAPFCECDEAKVVPYCTLCRKEAVCPVVWR